MPPSNGPHRSRVDPRKGVRGAINICPRNDPRSVLSRLRGRRRGEVVRLPQDGELVLDSFDRFARPVHEPRAVSVLEHREEVPEPVDDVFGLAGLHEHRRDEPAIVAHHEPVVPQCDLVDLAIPLGERLSHERRDGGDHAPTTSRSLSDIRLRDMCLIRSPFWPMRKTSSIMGSGGTSTTNSVGGGGGASGTSTAFMTGVGLAARTGAAFLTGARCQTSEEAHASASPETIASTQPARGVHARSVPVAGSYIWP